MIYLPLLCDKLTQFKKHYSATTLANKQITYCKVFTLQSDAFIYMHWSNAIRCNVVNAFYSIVKSHKSFFFGNRVAFVTLLFLLLEDRSAHMGLQICWRVWHKQPFRTQKYHIILSINDRFDRNFINSISRVHYRPCL